MDKKEESRERGGQKRKSRVEKKEGRREGGG